MNAANEGHRAMPPTAVADLETERAEEDGSEMAGPVRTSLSNRQPYSAWLTLRPPILHLKIWLRASPKTSMHACGCVTSLSRD